MIFVKLFYIISRAVRQVKFEAILKYHKWYLCQISRTIHAINCLYYNLRNSVIQRHVFIFVELFRFACAGEQIGFEVLVFCPAGPDSWSMYFSQYFGFPNFLLVIESLDFKISKSFRHFCVTRASRLFGDYGLL